MRESIFKFNKVGTRAYREAAAPFKRQHRHGA